MNRLKSIQTEWSFDKLISELRKSGIDVCVRCSRTANNEVTITIKTNTYRKSIIRLRELLIELYNIE